MKTVDRDRRRALAAIAALALSGAARGQARPATLKRFGMFCACDAESFGEFKKQLEKRGWVEGRNIEIVLRSVWNAEPREYPAIADEIVASRPDVILAYQMGPTRELKRATSVIPIVTTIADPVGVGFAASLSRPGGNITGLVDNPGAVAGLRVDSLRRMLPALDSIFLLIRGKSRELPDERSLPVIALIRGLGLTAKVIPAGTTLPDYEAALATIPPTRRAAVLAGATLPGDAPEDVPMLALRHRVPVCFQDRAYVSAGGLMSYSLQHADSYAQLIGLVDKILRGASPAELPFEQPGKSDFTINRATAAALGIRIPQDLLVRADAVFG